MLGVDVCCGVWDARARAASGTTRRRRIGEIKCLIGLCYIMICDIIFFIYLCLFELWDFFLVVLVVFFFMARRCARGSLAYSVSAVLRLLSVLSFLGVGMGGVEDVI